MFLGEINEVERKPNSPRLLAESPRAEVRQGPVGAARRRGRSLAGGARLFPACVPPPNKPLQSRLDPRSAFRAGSVWANPCGLPASLRARVQRLNGGR